MECFRIERTTTRGINGWVALLFVSDIVGPSQNSLRYSSLCIVPFGVSQFIVVLATPRSILLDFCAMNWRLILRRCYYGGNVIKIPMLIDPTNRPFLLGRRPLHPHPFALFIQ
jgi:hypothetical protein